MGGQAFADELAANEEYARGFTLRGIDPTAARGLAVLTCIDSRIEPLTMLGLRAGDAKILRNAGARVTDEVLRTLVIVRYLLGVERLMVIAHTDCRMTAASDTVLHEEIAASGGPSTTHLAFGTTPDPTLTLQADVERVRAYAEVGQLDVGGFLYDVDLARLTQVC